MHRFFPTILETIAAAFILVPLYWHLNKKYYHNKKETIETALFGLYICAVYAVVGLPNVTYFRYDPHINLTPFAYMFSDYESTILNVILFLPMGLFLPILWKEFQSILKILFFGFCTSLFIELLQIFTFRATDINDLMTNTLGTLLGYFVARILLKCKPELYTGERTGHLFVTCGISFCVMFFIQPFLSHLLWFILL